MRKTGPGPVSYTHLDVYKRQEVAPRIKELDEVDEYPIWMRDRMAELGFTRLVAPEEYGGFGESMTTLLMLIIEASKYNNNLASILNCSNNANKLLSFANQEQIDRFLPMICLLYTSTGTPTRC